MRVVFTKHALQRARECQLDIRKAVWLFRNAQPEKLWKGANEYKVRKYGEDSGSRYRNGTYVFVAKKVIDKFGHGEIILVITMTDQRITAGLTSQV